MARIFNEVTIVQQPRRVAVHNSILHGRSMRPLQNPDGLQVFLTVGRPTDGLALKASLREASRKSGLENPPSRRAQRDAKQALRERKYLSKAILAHRAHKRAPGDKRWAPVKQ